MAMGRNDEERDASLRFSFADDTPIEAMGACGPGSQSRS